MNKRYVWLAPMLSVLLLASCAGTKHVRQDLIHDTLNRDGIELHYDVTSGSGQSYVFVHGGAATESTLHHRRNTLQPKVTPS